MANKKLKIGERAEYWYFQECWAEIVRLSENKYELYAVDGNSSDTDYLIGTFSSILECEKNYN